MSTPNKEAGLQTVAWRYREAGDYEAYGNGEWHLIEKPWEEELQSFRWEHEELVRRADAEAVILDLRQNLEMARNIAKAEQEENESLRAALEDIRSTDPVDAALDPQRAVRIALAALAGAKPEQ